MIIKEDKKTIIDTCIQMDIIDTCIQIDMFAVLDLNWIYNYYYVYMKLLFYCYIEGKVARGPSNKIYCSNFNNFRSARGLGHCFGHW